MRVHTATTPLPATTALGRNRKAGFSPLVATNRDGYSTNKEHLGVYDQLSLQPPPPNPKISPPPSIRATYCSSGVVIPPSSPFNTQSVRVPTTPAHLFFLRKKIPASQKARVGTSTVSLARGANREVKERVKGKASRVQSTRIGSALVCVRRNVQHLELKLSKSTRFVLVTVVMVAVPTGVCVCVYVFIKLHITAQSGPVILVILCHSH